jgi:hypothetical protein
MVMVDLTKDEIMGLYLAYFDDFNDGGRAGSCRKKLLGALKNLGWMDKELKYLEEDNG